MAGCTHDLWFPTPRTRLGPDQPMCAQCGAWLVRDRFDRLVTDRDQRKRLPLSDYQRGNPA